MSRNIRNERVQLYLSNPEYYKEKLKGKIKEDQLAIAYYYLDDPTHTLFTTGRNFHISKERVRQICYKVLYKIWKMKSEEEDMAFENKKRKGYILFQEDPQKWEDVMNKHLSPATISIALMFLRDNKTIPQIRQKVHKDRGWVYACIKRTIDLIENIEEKETTNTSINIPILGMKVNSLKQEEFDAIKELLYQGETVIEISKNPTINRSRALIQRVVNAKTLEEFFLEQKEYYKNYITKKRSMMVKDIVISPSPNPLETVNNVIEIYIEQEVKNRVALAIKGYKEELKRKLEET